MWDFFRSSGSWRYVRCESASTPSMSPSIAMPTSGILSTTTGVGARRAAIAGEDMVGSRAAAKADAARRQAPTGLGQGAGAQPAEAGVAYDRMA